MIKLISEEKIKELEEKVDISTNKIILNRANTLYKIEKDLKELQKDCIKVLKLPLESEDYNYIGNVIGENAKNCEWGLNLLTKKYYNLAKEVRSQADINSMEIDNLLKKSTNCPFKVDRVDIDTCIITQKDTGASFETNTEMALLILQDILIPQEEVALNKKGGKENE